MLNKRQSVQISLLAIIIITLNTFFFVGNMIPVLATTGTSSVTGSDGRSNSNDTSIAEHQENRLINNLVKTGKFTEDEAREFVTKVMKNGTDESNVIAGLNIPEANLTANVPVPEANLTANVPVPEANLTANVPVPEANLT
ncbi:MAG: hypothetical protein QOC39_09915, partial [Nitrososphaeraceae archaeon]|nr:hypothetical protein [Nitrososphaeraceae archaeon]